MRGLAAAAEVTAIAFGGLIAVLDVLAAGLNAVFGGDPWGGDPWPYGIEPNRATLEALVQYLADQALIEKPVPLDELFVPIYGQEATS